MPILRYFSMFRYTCNASFKANNNTLRRCHQMFFFKSFSSLSIRYGRYAVFGAHSTCESIVSTCGVTYTTRVSKVLYSGCSVLSSSIFPSYDVATHRSSTSLFLFYNMSPSYVLNEDLITFYAVRTYLNTYRLFSSPLRHTGTRVITNNLGYPARHDYTLTTSYIRRVHMAAPVNNNTAYGVRQNTSKHVNKRIRTADVSSSINNMVSFYESCILEINKIAVEGKRVFRNHASSKKSSSLNRGLFTYVDDFPLSTNRSIRRFTYLNRRYARLRRKARKHLFYRVMRSKTYRRVRLTLKGNVTRFLKKKHNSKKKNNAKNKYKSKKKNNCQPKAYSKKTNKSKNNAKNKNKYKHKSHSKKKNNYKKKNNAKKKYKSKKKHHANNKNYYSRKAYYKKTNKYTHKYSWMIKNADTKVYRRKYSKEKKRMLRCAFRFFHSVELRANLKIHITTRIPYITWCTKYGLVASRRTYRAWESYISFKINSTLFREIRKLVRRASKRRVIPNNFVSEFRYYIRIKYRKNLRTKWPICYSKSKVTNTKLRDFWKIARNVLVDVIHTCSDDIFTHSLFTRFMSNSASLLSVPCPVTRYVSKFNMDGIMLNILLFLPKLQPLNLYVANASLLSFEYQFFDRIYMSVRTVFSISQNQFTGYVELCSFIEDLSARTFVFFHRSYVYQVCRRAILSSPSERGAEVLAMLPKKHRDMFVSLSHTVSMARRYRDKLIRDGVLHIPDFYNKTFTFFCNRKLDARDLHIVHLNTIRFKHILHVNKSYVLYTFFFYYYLFFYSSGTSFLQIISRYRFFYTSSFICQNKLAFSSTSSNMFDSFTRCIVHFDCPSDSIKTRADTMENKSYFNIKPFFHGDAIVFFFSPLSKKTQVRYTFASLLSTSRTVLPVLFRLRNTHIYTWNALSNRYLYSNAQSRILRRIDNSFCNRLVSQSGTTNALISSYLYTGRLFKSYVKLYKKSRKYFSMCRRRYQTKWFN